MNGMNGRRRAAAYSSAFLNMTASTSLEGARTKPVDLYVFSRLLSDLRGRIPAFVRKPWPSSSRPRSEQMKREVGDLRQQQEQAAATAREYAVRAAHRGQAGTEEPLTSQRCREILRTWPKKVSFMAICCRLRAHRLGSRICRASG